MEWWHQAGVLAGIATIATVLLAKKRRISKTYVYGPFSDYEEAMAVHESVKAEYEVAAEIGNLELKELTLPTLRGGPTGMKGGYAFTITVLGFPPTLAAEDADRWLPINVGRDNQLFEWLQKQSVFYCNRCNVSSEDEELHRVLTDDYHFVIYCDDCFSKVFPQFDAEEMGRTEVATALLHKAKNWPFIQSFDYEHPSHSPEELIQLGHPIKILNSWDDLEQSDIGSRSSWFYINFPLTVYRGSLKAGKWDLPGIEYDTYLEHEHITPSQGRINMGYHNVIPTSPYLSEALNYSNASGDIQYLEGGEPSELYSFDIQDYVVTFPRTSFTVRGHEDKPVVMVAGGILIDDTTLLWNTDEDSSWYGAEEEEEDTYAHALAEMKKYLMMTLGVTIPGIGTKQRDAARDFWEWFENKAETYHTTEIGDYECTYYTPEVKQCFYNAFMTLSEIEDAKYYEGWAVTLSGISIPIEHAWLVTKEGRVIDTTFALLEREYGHDKSEVVYMGVEIPYSYLLNAVVESGRAGPFLRNYWADDTDSGIEHEYRLYFAEGDPDYYPKHPRSHRSDPNLPWGRSPWDKQKDPYAPKPEEWDRDSREGDQWRRNKKPQIKPTQYVRLINYPLFSAQKGQDLREVEARVQAKRKQIKDMYESYHPQMPRGYGEKDIGDYFSK